MTKEFRDLDKYYAVVIIKFVKTLMDTHMYQKQQEDLSSLGRSKVITKKKHETWY